MKKNLKKLLNNYKKYRYDKILNTRDLELLRGMEKESGFKLSTKMKKEIDEYARETFGSVSYAPSLYVYTVYNK